MCQIGFGHHTSSLIQKRLRAVFGRHGGFEALVLRHFGAPVGSPSPSG
jgi:hypothetical protein